MADGMSITVDTTALFAAMDKCVVEVEKALKANAKVTADNIAREVSARAARAASGPTRGSHMADHVIVEETRNGDGYVVYVRHPEMPNQDLWLEVGTKHMTARPFFFSSARLEEGAHDRRAREAVQSAIDAVGLGD